MSTTSNLNKNSYSKKRSIKKHKSAMDYKIEQIAKEVMKRETVKNTELKFYDREIFNQASSSSGTIYSLSNLIPQGTANQQRIADEIYIKSCFIRLNILANSSATYDTTRVILVRWYAETAPVVGDILQTTANAAIRELSQLNVDGAPNFRVLYDQSYITSDSTNYDLPEVQMDKFYVKTEGKAQWNIGGAAIHGHLYLLVISNATLNFPLFNMTSRVRYTDK